MNVFLPHFSLIFFSYKCNFKNILPNTNDKKNWFHLNEVSNILINYTWYDVKISSYVILYKDELLFHVLILDS